MDSYSLFLYSNFFTSETVRLQVQLPLFSLKFDLLFDLESNNLNGF